MNASEIPEQSQGEAVSGISPELAALRALTVVLHNSRSVCWMTMGCGVVSVPLGICMVLEGGSLLFPLSAINFMAALAAAQWILGGLMMCAMCPWAWKWGARMLSYSVKLDAKGVDLNFGTKKHPDAMFMAWEQVDAVQQKRIGKIWEYTILGNDGRQASYTTYAFFRPTHVARKIAEHAGLTVQKV